MQPLRVDYNGGSVAVDHEHVVTIGRAPDAEVRLPGESVSRRHAELRPTPQGWLLVDVGSQFGTWVDGERVTERLLQGRTTVNCGVPATGATLTISVGAPSAYPAQPPVPVPGAAALVPGVPRSLAEETWQSAPDLDQTQVVGRPVLGAAPQTGPDLLVRLEDQERRFTHPAVVTIGRNPQSTMVVKDPAASRFHGRIDPVPGGWVYTNMSAEGTYHGGRRVETLKVTDGEHLRLAHPVAGPELFVTPLLSAEEESRRMVRQARGRRLKVYGAIAAAALLVIGTVAGLLLWQGGGSPPADGGPDRLTATELDGAKMATVLLGARTTTADGRTIQYTGSGSIISEDGLILTNAHVAAPSADGLSELYPNELQINDPDYLEVALITSPDDSPADPEYRARLVKADGHIDAAVIKIYATIDGDPISGPLALPTMPLGDSDLMHTGDDVTVLGFPGISQSMAVSVTKGVISTFIDDPDLGKRSEIDTDARIAPGNSGGAAINDDAQIIGIPSAYIAQQGIPIASGRIRPINIVKPLIASVE